MPRAGDKREKLVNAAKALIHRQGFNRTTLAHIAAESGVPLGNVYYYFKSKDEIVIAVIKSRIEGLQSMAQQWERELEPRQRLYAFLVMVDDMAESIAHFGCPVGSLCQELGKSQMPLADKPDMVIEWLLNWATCQFEQMGRADAADQGLHFISALQGAGGVAHAMNNPALLSQQVKRVRAWVEAL